MKNNYPDLSNKSFFVPQKMSYGFNTLFIVLGFLFLSLNSYAQCNDEIPRPFVTANFDNLSVSKSTFTSGIGLCIGCSITNEANLINASLTDFATASFGALNVGYSHSLRVTDGNTTYAAGTFAGFKIAPTGGLLTLNLLNGITIRTYDEGVLKEAFSGASLLGLSVLSSSTDYIVGFNTSIAFDAIEIVLDGGISALSSTNIYHAVIREYCAGPALECNTITKLSLPTYPVAIDQTNTGVSGVSVGSVSNVENAISSDNSDYATINLTAGLLASGSIAIKDQLTNYPAGTYAGVEIENTALLSLNALGNVVVATYLDGVQKESFSGSNLLANVSLIPSSGPFKLGFVSTQDFDEVKLTLNQTLALNLGTTRVYGAVFEKFCAGPDLSCNTQTAIIAPTYPVYVNNVNSGINGLACALCTITNQDNLIDADLTNYASVNLSVGVGTTGSLSVKNQITDYPAGTFAGYTIENPALLTVDALNTVRITTYLNGVQQETKSGNGALVAVGTDLLVSTGKQTIGFVSAMPFDEVKITFQNTVAVNLGEVKVYNSVLQKLCEPVVECNKTYVWSNPDFPVIIDTDNSGVQGVACVSCAVTDTDNLLTADETDYANITLIAGVVGSGSVAVKDQLFTYPKGTFAGYVIKDLGSLAQVNLLQSLSISTYNNGVLQESGTAGQLIDLSALGLDVLGSVPGTYNIGFKTTLPFDEIRLTLNSVASVINSINVYGAFIDTSESDGGDGSALDCNASSVSITKDGTYVDANLDGKVNVGDRIDYTFVITNTGAKTLTNITVTDDNATVTGTPIASLAPGATDTTSYTASYTITQADIDAAVVYNLATVTAVTNIGTSISATSTDPTPCTSCPVDPDCPDCTITEVLQTDGIALVKTAVVGGTGVKGDVITYTFAVTNTGNTTLTNVVVTDPMTMSGLTISGSPIANLAPGATDTSVTGVYIITQTDVDAGKVTNSALATAKDPQGNDVTDTSGTTITTDDSTETPVTQNSSVALVKTAVVGGTGGLGDTITYTFAVTNTGNTTLTNIVVTDPMPDLVISGSPIASLAPGATSLAITGTYIIKQTDVDAGKVSNQATVTAKDPQNNDVTDLSGTTVLTDDTTETPVGNRSTIALVKSASIDGTGTGLLGETITYTFAVTNTGTTTLTNVKVTDPMTGLTITGSPIATLAPAATDSSITGTYIITQADIDAGKVTNQATVTAKDPSDNDVTDISGTTIGTNDATETPVTQSPAIVLVKTGVYNGNASKAAVGDSVTYTFTVTNTGNTTLYNVIVSDPMTGLIITGNPIASLAPGTSNATITGTYLITQTDINAGKVSNQAKATAKDSEGNNVEDFSGTDVNNDDSTETTLPQSSTIALMKTASISGTGTGLLGETITYTFTVKNTGNTILTNVEVTDPMTGLTITGSPIASLAPGVTNTTITGTYVITQADVDAGKVSNQATATAKDPQNNDVTDLSGTTLITDDITETPLTQNSAIALVKTASIGGTGTGLLGEVITYTFTVKNTGNTTLAVVEVTDPMTGLAITGSPITTLAPGATNATITGTYVITQADVDAGKVSNQATVNAKDPQDNDVTDLSGTTLTTDDVTETPLTQNSTIALMKTASVGGTGTGLLGETITYTFTVKNTGNTTLTNVVVTDDVLSGIIITGSPIATLAPGATNATITGTYVITQADVDAGKVSNQAIATAKDPQNNDVTDLSGTTLTTDDVTETPLTKNSAIALVKTAVYNGNASKAQVGDTVTYTFTVTNTGNVTVNNIAINDTKLGVSNLTLVPSSLAPAGIGTATKTYTITQADIDAGKVTNTAIAQGQDPQGVDVQDISGTAVDNDDSTVTNIPQSFSIALVKTAQVVGAVTVGGTVNYTFSVTNTGNGVLTNIIVTDGKSGLTIPVSTIASLAVGETNSTITGTYTITQADIDARMITNSALVVGKDPNGNDVSDVSGTTLVNNTPTTTPITPNPAISITKDGIYEDTNGDGKTNVGDHINYVFEVRNTGDTTLYNVSITDPMVTVQGTPLVTLARNASDDSTFTARYAISQEDINNGVVFNLATAKGTTAYSVDVTATSTDPTPCVTCPVDPSCPTCTVTILEQSPSIALMLTGEFQDENGDGQAQIGETIRYTYTIMNTGDVPLTNVWIQNTLVGLDSNSGTVNMAIGAMDNTTFYADYSITQADIIAGHVINQATVYGTSPLGVIVQDMSDDDSPLEDDATVIGVDGCRIEIFNAVSPNTGSIYERILFIRGLDCYPNNSVQIFDRWGVKVFEVDGYDNNTKVFRGISEGRTTVSQSKALPSGTYFYTLNYVDQQGKGYNKAGYLHLINE